MGYYYNRYTGEYYVGERDFTKIIDSYSKTEFMPEDVLEDNHRKFEEIQEFIIEDIYDL